MPHFLSHMKCSKIPAQSPSSYSPTGDIDWQLERDGDGAVKQISVLNIISNLSIKTECVTAGADGNCKSGLCLHTSIFGPETRHTVAYAPIATGTVFMLRCRYF